MKAFLNLMRAGVVSLAQTILAILAGFCIYTLATILNGESGNWTWLLAFFVAPLFTFPVALIHEAGHAAAALGSGWIVDRIVVWPVGYAPRTKTWALVSRPIGRGEIGGWVVARPQLGRGSSRQEAFFILGGVIANVSSAVLCILAARFLPYGVWPKLLTAFAVFSIVVAITNIIPWKIAGVSNDGLQLWRLWRSARHRKPKQRKTKSQWNEPREG